MSSLSVEGNQLDDREGREMKMRFRLPERLGPFSAWMAPEVYPLAQDARRRGETHRILAEARLALDDQLVGDSRIEADREFLISAAEYYRSLENLWAELDRELEVLPKEASNKVRGLFLASAVEWALDLHYEVRKVERKQAETQSHWQVSSRAWDGDRFRDVELSSESFPALDEYASERALQEVLARAYTRAIGGLMALNTLAGEPDTAGNAAA